MPKVAALVVVVAVAMFAMRPGFRAVAMPQDEGAVLVYPELMLNELLMSTRR